ncbi:family 43 glycosylhydrolase [Amycolatopsis sp. K13G38]|uniref:Family 43 glycosylhydrolase n=1 Tax=Amycolatopsis acididurans TaxID=2724524 RepID=A0ABX1J828_9PSEU|nr:glycoside hydrolase family 43 protein [Amycolatopsis acididurans]NKQ55714.1 family 43 glycosylhydrolase [Amycolatopsis acididurans]
MWRRTTLALAVASLTGLGTVAAHADEQPKLAINHDFADPGILDTGFGYRAYSTNSDAGRIPTATAPKADGPWTIRGDALPTAPSWTAPDAGFWAPDVTQRSDGKYLMYFAANNAAGGDMCVGAATSSQPGGPFAPTGTPAVCDRGGDIDPQGFTDRGHRYLLYKSNAAPTTIWLQEVGSDGLTPRGPRTPLLHADRPEENGNVEAPALVKSGSRYRLYYSAADFASPDYHTSYADSPSITGPYAKNDAPVLSTGGPLRSPGGADVAGGHLFFHSWLGDGHQARGMYVK